MTSVCGGGFEDANNARRPGARSLDPTLAQNALEARGAHRLAAPGATAPAKTQTWDVHRVCMCAI